MKTFRELVPGNFIYKGMQETDARQITNIQTIPETGSIIISFWELNKVMNMQVEDKIEVKANNLDQCVVLRAGKGIFYYSSRQAALDLRVQYLQNNIAKLQAEIAEREASINKLWDEIRSLYNEIPTARQ